MAIFHSLQDPEVVHLLNQGAVGVLPTDTVYGLVASAANHQAVAQLYRLKNREQKPGTTIAASTQQLIALGIDAATIQRVAHLWPNPISVVLPLPPEMEYLHMGLGSSPFRVVADTNVRALLEQTGPLVTSSANMPGGKPATNLAEAQGYFDNHIDFYVDAGDIGDRPPSTIVRLTLSGVLEVIRQGAVTINDKGEIAA
ncbi:MAG TPA: L-threonylcarbamoyladenylate synthase [Nevskiaceae bacterium]|nr:L-threonylcarbamoyladenylate synthase [Nevskiaceae bacterium]